MLNTFVHYIGPKLSAFGIGSISSLLKSLAIEEEHYPSPKQRESDHTPASSIPTYRKCDPIGCPGLSCLAQVIATWVACEDKAELKFNFNLYCLDR